MARAVADGKAAEEAGDAGGAGRAAAGRGVPVAALWPPSATASAIATPAARTPATTAAPDRKLISSMRA